MTQHGWRLERTYLAGAGRRESRLEGLDIVWSNDGETEHSALWADNGTGKTMITALRYALYLPHARDFIRGDSDRSLAHLVRSDDVCHVVEQSTRVVDTQLQRVVVGMVASWGDGRTQDLDNPSKLSRTFYGWIGGPDDPTIDDLPFRTAVGRWSTHKQFTSAVRELLPHGGATAPFSPSDHQRHWQDWLLTSGIDLDQVRFQTVMNASEGGVDRVMQFADSDAFVHWLIGATMPVSAVDQITNSIETLRTNAAARPRWETELDLWDRVLEPLLNLAVAHEQVATDRQKAMTARADAASVIADADATIAALTERAATERERHRWHDQRRRDVQAIVRRAQAHRLRLRIRAAELRAEHATQRANTLTEHQRHAMQQYQAWRLVEQVLAARDTQATVVRLEEHIQAADKKTAELHNDEQRLRHDLARLFTHQRDTAAEKLARAKDQVRHAREARQQTHTELTNQLTQRGAIEEKIRSLENQCGDAEQTIAAAVADGLLVEGSDPAAVAADLEQAVKDAQATRKRAEAALTEIDAKTRTAQDAIHAAQRKATTARDDSHAATRELRTVTQRIESLESDESVVEAAGGRPTDLWRQRTDLTDRLTHRATDADSDVANARDAMAEAQRVVEAVGADGLLPPSHVAEECARRCQTANIPAWPGWRWLADTITPAETERFARARPDIVSGVVVAHPDLVDQAVDAIGELDLDVALWVGAVVDLHAATNLHQAHESTPARVILPPPGMYDREAATAMVDNAQARFTVAEHAMQAAKRLAQNARTAIATLERLWTDFPHDPRSDLAKKIEDTEAQRAEAERAVQQATDDLATLEHDREEHQRTRDTAQQAADADSERRLQLAPTVTAAATLATNRAQLPVQRQTLKSANERIAQLERDREDLDRQVAYARDHIPRHTRTRDNAAEQLRHAGLTPTTEGPVPTDDQTAIEARLDGVQAAIDKAAPDPELRSALESHRRRLSDLSSTLDADPELRTLAEQFADTDEARHPVALATATREAEQQFETARTEAATARAEATSAQSEYERRLDDSSDRSSPDVEGYPPAAQVATHTEAEQLADRLDTLATERLEEQRREQQRAGEADEAARNAQHQVELLTASIRPMRHHHDPELTGRIANNVPELVDRVTKVDEYLRDAEHTLGRSETEQRRLLDSVRHHANSPHARKVEDQNDPRVVDLIDRLRGDEQLPADAERIAAHLEQRAASLKDDLTHHDEHVRTCATMLHVQAVRAIERLRSYRNQSRLPEGLGDWSHQTFVDITHEPLPADESVAIDRVARIVHAQLTPGAGRSDARTMLFAAARALVEAPFRVRLLKPHTDLSVERADVADLKNFSGGQRVTAGVLMYAAMARVRAAGNDSVSVGWLWLDNPFGQASADQFIRTMRLAADRLGIQLLFTAAPKDKGALSMFDRVITLSRRLRPSAGEKVVVVEDKQQQVVDLALVQKDVMAVLGE